MGGMCNGMDGRKGTAMKALRHRLAELDSGVRNAWLLIAILVVALICTMETMAGLAADSVSAADCLAEFIFVAIVVWMLSRGGVAIPWPDGGSDTMSGSADGAASSSALDGSVADGGAADGGSSSSGSDITDADCPLETQTYPPAPASTVTNNY